MTQIQLDTLPKSRKEAQALNVSQYFTGKACKHGHVESRNTCDGTCRECARQKFRSWAKRNDRSEYNAAYERANRERLNLKRLAWYHKNGGDQGRAARRQNPLTHAAARSAWRRANRAKIRAYERQQLADNHGYRVGKYLRNRVNAALKAQAATKAFCALEVTGCSWLELRAHLESQFQPGMTWDNYGIHGWHIDHIIPCASFDLTDPEQQKTCFHYTNLQPLWALDNIKKGASRS